MENTPQGNPKEPKISLLAKVSTIVPVSLFLGILFNYFFYDKALGIGFFIFIGLIIAGFFFLASESKMKVSKQVSWLLAPLAFFSFMVFVRSSPMLTVLNVLASMLILLLIVKASFLEKIKNFIVTDWLKTIILPFSFIAPAFQTLSKIFTFKGTSEAKKKWSRIAKGVLISLPILFVFTMFFSSADLAFNQSLSNMFSFDIESG